MKVYLSLAAALFLTSLLSGCYTVLSHPDIATVDENGYSYNTKVNFYDDCKSCHTSADKNRYVKQNNLSPVKAHQEKSYQDQYTDSEEFDGNYSDNYDEYYDSYYPTPYYPAVYYGSYGYYYNRPWWYDVTPPPVDSRAVEATKQANQHEGRTRNNDGGRNESTTRGSGLTISSPGTASSGSSSSSSSSSSSGSSSSTSSTNSSGSSDSRSSSSGGSSTRNNDGQRSTNTGRR